MAVLQSIINVILHLSPDSLSSFMGEYGFLTYVIIFLIIFCETGLVVTPFLPGDSLVFAVGALASISLGAKGSHAGTMGWPVLVMLIFAAVLGNMLNYQIGKTLSDRIMNRQKIRFIKMEYIDETRLFFKKYGASTIIITRFMPIIRTFAPFVAGVGEMPYRRFFVFNAIGGVAWASFFYFCGFFFGKIPAVSNHFSMVVVGIVLVSVVPAAVIFLKKRFGKPKPEIK